MGSSEYKATALATARKNGLTAEQVEAMGPVKVAALSQYVIGSNGDKPTDFFFQNIRRYIANQLRMGVEAAAELGMENAILAKLDPAERAWLEDKLSTDSISAEVSR